MPENIIPLVLINILFLLLAIAVGLFIHKRAETEESNALNDIKNGLKAGLPYTVIVSIFIYLFYNNINPEYNQHQIVELETSFEKAVNNPEELALIKSNNEDFEVMNKEEILAELKKGPREFYAAGSTMTLSLLAMLMMSTLYSIFVTAVYRKVLFRRL